MRLFAGLAEAWSSAPLYTFSNTRGTARMKVGWKLPRSATRFATSGVCPRTVPDSRQPIWMMRAKEWASGRKSRAERPGTVKISGRAPIALRTSASMFACVSSHPLGRPVVPEV